MARRWYVCPVIGSGQEEDAYRPSILQYTFPEGTRITPSIATLDTGELARDWCLVRVDTTDHSPITADADVTALPDITLDALLSTINASTRNKILSFLEAKGVDLTGISTSSTFRDLIRKVGVFLTRWFNEER